MYPRLGGRLPTSTVVNREKILIPSWRWTTYLHGYKHGGSSYPLPAGGPSPPWLHVRRRSASPSTVTSTATCKKETCTPLTEVLHHPNV